MYICILKLDQMIELGFALLCSRGQRSKADCKITLNDVDTVSFVKLMIYLESLCTKIGFPTLNSPGNLLNGNFLSFQQFLQVLEILTLSQSKNRLHNTGIGHRFATLKVEQKTNYCIALWIIVLRSRFSPTGIPR